MNNRVLIALILLSIVGVLWSVAFARAETTASVDISPAASAFVRHAAERGAFRANPPAISDIEKGQRGWKTVYSVLMSPRCMNCHPVGDAPLQTDQSRPHAMNISRSSEKNGLACSSCHQTKNSDEIGAIGGPPGAPNWHLPPEEMPLVFEGRTISELCRQMKNPNSNGRKTLGELKHHVTHDALVLWGWEPGGKRTTPPVTHAVFVQAFTAWADAGAPCPDRAN